ncbi:hypothetical protein IQ255_16290 [Pleurocapsales cyanobacterium LEGE 10410]|nr:hypothetical protein [Pleurocapsales cyanobacterium LEGE 10410]
MSPLSCTNPFFWSEVTMMESPMTRNCHVGFGERYEETHQSQDWEVRFVPTPSSPLLANVALNGIERIGEFKRNGKDNPICVRYADDMIFFLKPQDNANELLNLVKEFLAKRGMEISEKKTKLTRATDGFNFLGWHFKVQNNGKFRSTPSEENFKAFRKKVKDIVNSSNLKLELKVDKLSRIIRGWRQYHKYCKMDGSRFSLWHMNHRTFKVFNKGKNTNKHKAIELIKTAFPAVPYSENKFVNVKGITVEPFFIIRLVRL